MDNQASTNPILPAKKKNSQLILYVLAGAAILILLIVGAIKLFSFIAEREKCSVIHQAIEPYFQKYNISNFEVKSERSVYCKDFENLSDADKFNLLKDICHIGDVEIDGEEISIRAMTIMVSKNARYSLTRTLTSAVVAAYGGFSTPGLYYEDTGGSYLVYAGDN